MTAQRARIATVATAFAAAVFTLGCASRATNPINSAHGAGQAVELTVHNNDFNDADIYAYWNGSRERVGMVTGKTTKTFRMEWRGEEIQIQVDFVGGGQLWSGPIDVYEGDQLDWVILPQS